MRTTILIFANILFTIAAAAQDTTFYQNAEWSPDGKKIITEGITKNGNNLSFNSYIIDVKTQTIEKTIANAVFPAWSPDGKYIAWSKRTGVKNNSDIWMMNIVTGDTVQITNVPSGNSGVSFSPDGKKICFSSNREGKNNLYVVGRDGSGLEKITADTFRYFNPVWKPGANEIVYYRERGDNKDKVFMMRLADKKEIKITDDTLHNIYPDWLPGGKTILYCFVDQSVNDGNNRQLAFIDVDGNNRRIVPGSTGAFFARVSADGKKIAFTKGNWPESHIYIINIDGTNMQCLTCGLKKNIQ